jgi:hypothetical protein
MEGMALAASSEEAVAANVCDDLAERGKVDSEPVLVRRERSIE